jgi:hypothetical protein
LDEVPLFARFSDKYGPIAVTFVNTPIWKAMLYTQAQPHDADGNAGYEKRERWSA